MNLEFGAVGALLNNNSFEKESGLEEKHFKNPIARRLWIKLTEAIEEGKPVDSYSILDLLDDREYSIIGECVDSAWSPTLSLTHANTLKAQRKVDRVKELGHILIAEPERVDEVITELRDSAVSTTHSYELKSVLDETLKYIDDVANGKINSVPSGIQKLDYYLGGFHPSDLVVIAARPAMGKTALALNMLLKTGVSAGVFSCEMGRVQLGSRLLSIDSGVHGQKIRQSKLDDTDFTQLVSSINQMKELPIHINDKPAPTMREIIAQAREWHREHQIEIIFIDYLQRIKMLGKEPRHEKVGECARQLKELARDLDIPVVLLAQVNRQADGIRPNMSHLAQSGEIEAESDQIMFLYRDEVYNPQTEDKGIAEILIEKNRHGATGGIRCAWNAPAMQFRNLSEDWA